MSRLLDAIVRGAIERRALVLVLAIGLVAAGLWQARQARFDALPDFTPPRVVVQTEAPGMSAGQVEQQVTSSLERVLLATPALATLRSTSSEGLSVLELVFRDGTDLLRARQLVSERLASVRGDLPEGVGAPRLAPITAPVGAMLKLCLVADRRGAMGPLWRFAQWRLRPRLLAIPGVSQVTVHGGAAERLEVQPDVPSLVAHGIRMGALARAIGAGQETLAAGFLERGGSRRPIRANGTWTLQGARDAVAATQVPRRAGLPVRVGDVARVRPGVAPRVGSALYDGHPAIYVQVDKLPWADTLATTRAVERALRSLDAALPRFTHRAPPTYRQLDFVDRSLRSVGHAMLLGAVLVTLLLLLFLRSWRLAVISLVAIPLSLLAAGSVLVWAGVRIDGMVLGGLAIATGEVVDDAIVDVENIWRRLRENAQRPSPRPALQVIHDASVEVRGAVIYATLIIVAVLAPILLLGGVTGRIFSPLAEAYGLAMIASLLVALVVTPALAALLLPAQVRRRGAQEPSGVGWLRRRYRALLERVARRPGWVLAPAGTLALLAIGALPFVGGGFLPEFHEGVLIAGISARPGTSLRETARLAATIQRRLRARGLVTHSAARVGRATLDEDAAPVSRVEMDLVLPRHDGDPEARLRAIAREMARLPGIRFSIEGFLGERVNELLSGERAPVAVKLYGPDLGRLRQMARTVLTVSRAIPALVDPRCRELVDVATRDVVLDDARLARWGLGRKGVLRALAAWNQGLEVTRVQAPRGFTLPVVIAPPHRGPGRLSELPLFLGSGRVVPLSQVAQVRTGLEPPFIRHEGGQRLVSVVAQVRPGTLSAAAATLEKRIASAVRVGAGYRLEIAGRAAERRAASVRIAAVVSLVLLLVLVFLWMAFGSLGDAAVVLGGLPLGLVGGVTAALLLPDGLSMAGMVGFVTLSGIITRNGVMLVAHKRQLAASHPDRPRREVVIQAAEERLLPILMTAGAAFLGLTPLALSLGAGGSELEAPMAVIVCLGLLTSTILNLVALPAWYLWRAGGAARARPAARRGAAGANE